MKKYVLIAAGFVFLGVSMPAMADNLRMTQDDINEPGPIVASTDAEQVQAIEPAAGATAGTEGLRMTQEDVNIPGPGAFTAQNNVSPESIEPAAGGSVGATSESNLRMTRDDIHEAGQM